MAKYLLKLYITGKTPRAALAIAIFLVREALVQMDVPTRTSYVMSVVSPEERPIRTPQHSSG